MNYIFYRIGRKIFLSLSLWPKDKKFRNACFVLVSWLFYPIFLYGQVNKIFILYFVNIYFCDQYSIQFLVHIYVL